MIAVLALAGAAHPATAGDGRVRHDAVAHLRPGLRTLLAIHGPRLSAGVRVGRSAGGRR